DLIDTHTASFVLTSTDAAADLPGFAEGSGSGAANIGTFAIDSSVNESNSDTINTGSLGWSFTLNDGNAVLQSLAAGQVLTQVYTVTLEDNNGAMTSQAVTISITGTNDGPTITSAVQAGSVTEDVAVSLPVLDGDVVIDAGGNLSTAGTVTFQDIDLIDTHTASFVLTSTDAAADLP